MALSDYEKGIRKTGFCLEYAVCAAFRDAGWSVISNRFYIDDASEIVREIDAVVYRMKRVQGVDVCTAIIVSCKKSESNAFALLSRKFNPAEPNRNATPLHAWTSNKALQHNLSDPGFAEQYYAAAKKGKVAALADLRQDVFAFQELSRSGGAPQNDRAIFTAITSLMKAQAFELSELPSRHKNDRIYFFSLLSVVDAELIRLEFDSGTPKAFETESETFLAHYMLRARREFARIRFITSKQLGAAISEFGELQAFHERGVEEWLGDFYRGILRDPVRRDVLAQGFINDVQSTMSSVARDVIPAHPTLDIWLSWNDKTEKATIQVEADESVVDYLRESNAVSSKLSAAFAAHYRYGGAFEIECADPIPF